MKYLIIILLINIILSLNSAATYDPSKLPLNAKTLGTIGFAVASDYNNWINPASMSYNRGESIEFSQNNWIFDDVSGASFNFRSASHAISYHYWKIDDIDLYGDVPSDYPDGSISTENIFFQYSKSFEIKKHSLGFNLAVQYMNFFDVDTNQFSIDIGYQTIITDYLKLGLAVKNIYSNHSGDSNKDPKLIVVGTKQIFQNIPFVLYLDLFYDERNGTGTFQGLKFNNKIFNLVCGVKYLSDFESTDFSLGMGVNWSNFEFSISMLFPDNSSFKEPIFYQISYMF